MSKNALVASPSVKDPAFYKTVILLLKKDDEGAMGLVINRTEPPKVSDLVKLVTPSLKPEEIAKGLNESSLNHHIHCGGPIRGPVVAIHKLENLADDKIITGLFWTNDADKLKQIIISGEPFRIYTGYSGWGKGQLENELKNQVWREIEITSDLVFDDPEGVWEAARKLITADYLQLLGVSQANHQFN